MHTPDPTRLPTMGPWIPVTGDEPFRDGDRILLAIPIVGGSSGAKYMPHSAPWRYDFEAVTICCDEHFFNLERFDGECCEWGLEDADYYLELWSDIDRP